MILKSLKNNCLLLCIILFIGCETNKIEYSKIESDIPMYKGSLKTTEDNHQPIKLQKLIEATNKIELDSEKELREVHENAEKELTVNKQQKVIEKLLVEYNALAEENRQLKIILNSHIEKEKNKEKENNESK